VVVFYCQIAAQLDPGLICDVLAFKRYPKLSSIS